MNAATAPAGAPPRPRGRFAPSPTGPLHFGSLVAALASCCDARKRGGEWLLRIEDLDTPRAPRAIESLILSQLERCGFAWDGAVMRQRARAEAYDAALQALRASGRVYECACTRRELASAPSGIDGERVYQGACRDGIPAERQKRVARSSRLRVPADDHADGLIDWTDRLQGRQAQRLASEVGDFILRRADGIHAYQLAVVVDDAAQGITDVVRGADLVASTPRQIFLQRLLGVPTPSYLHVPIAVDAAGFKLSKQTGAAALADDPLPALIAAWTFLGQPLPRGSAQPSTLAEFWTQARDAWSPARLPAVRTRRASGVDAPV